MHYKQKMQVNERKITQDLRHNKRQIWVLDVQPGIRNAKDLHLCILLSEVNMLELGEPFYELYLASISISDTEVKISLTFKK